mgnify:CR=1 FL=1
MNIEKAKAAYSFLINSVRTVVLGTVNSEAMPHVSYAPFVMDKDKNIYIFVSKLSPHTFNLQANARASVMLIEDENKSKQIFARRRITYSCHATLIDKNSPESDDIANKFEKKFGNLIYIFRNLPDFNIMKFTPQSGLFIIDFGAAYKIYSNDLNHLIQVTEGGQDEQ